MTMSETYLPTTTTTRTTRTASTRERGASLCSEIAYGCAVALGVLWLAMVACALVSNATFGNSDVYYDQYGRVRARPPPLVDMSAHHEQLWRAWREAHPTWVREHSNRTLATLYTLDTLVGLDNNPDAPPEPTADYMMVMKNTNTEAIEAYLKNEFTIPTTTAATTATLIMNNE